jgi:uncharacterized membrane protein
MPGEAELIVHIIQKRIIRKFRDEGATHPRQAATLEAVGVKKSGQIKTLVKKKVLIAADENRYYLDEDAADQYFQKKRRAALIGVGISLLILLIFLLVKNGLK